MQQWSSAQRDVSLTQLPGLKHLSPGAEVSKLCRDYAATRYTTWSRPAQHHHDHSV